MGRGGFCGGVVRRGMGEVRGGKEGYREWVAAVGTAVDEDGQSNSEGT